MTLVKACGRPSKSALWAIPHSLVAHGGFDGLLPKAFVCPRRPRALLCAALAVQEYTAKGYRSKYTDLFELQVDKTVQLYDTMNTRHSTMIVGPTGGGKTVIIQTLAAAQKAAFDQTVKLHVINPKAQTTNELYGVLGKLAVCSPGRRTYIDFSERTTVTGSLLFDLPSWQQACADDAFLRHLLSPRGLLQVLARTEGPSPTMPCWESPRALAYRLCL